MLRTFFLPTLVTSLALLLFGINTAAANEAAVSPDVQKAIDQIKQFNGQFTLTPENTIGTITFTNGSQLAPEMFDLFAQQADLTLLSVIDYRGLNDAVVAKLTGLKKLRRLRLTNSGITDVAVKTIAEAFPDLIELDISYNSLLTDAATVDIGKLEKLEILGLLYCNFSDFGILNIVGLSKLRALDIRGNMRIGDGGMDALTFLPALRSLKHRSPAVSNSGIRSLSQSPVLSDLEIWDMQITGQAGEHLARMEKLTQLQICRCESFDSTGVLALGGLKLTRLTLRNLPIDDSALEVFKELPTIKLLFFQELASITDEGMENLSHLKELERLEIVEVDITDKSLETISKLENLKTLVLRGTKVTDAGLELLLKLPKLEKVTLRDNTGVTPAMIRKLREAEKFVVDAS